MDIKIIIFSMMAILAILFIAAKFYVPWERKLMMLEASYFEALLLAKKDNNLVNKEKLFKLGKAFGKSEDEISRDLA